jgi:hypothetical protein
MTATVFVSVVVAIAAFTGLIAGIKGRRRRLRRRARTPAGQVAGAWSELIDLCRDLGAVIPAGRTRREQSLSVTALDVSGLARRGDASVFGPGQPSLAEVAEYWSSIDAIAGQLRAQIGWIGRWRARVSLRSFLPAVGTA